MYHHIESFFSIVQSLVIFVLFIRSWNSKSAQPGEWSKVHPNPTNCFDAIGKLKIGFTFLKGDQGKMNQNIATNHDNKQQNKADVIQNTCGSKIFTVCFFTNKNV